MLRQLFLALRLSESHCNFTEGKSWCHLLVCQISSESAHYNSRNSTSKSGYSSVTIKFLSLMRNFKFQGRKSAIFGTAFLSLRMLDLPEIFHTGAWGSDLLSIKILCVSDKLGARNNPYNLRHQKHGRGVFSAKIKVFTRSLKFYANLREDSRHHVASHHALVLVQRWFCLEH